MGKWSDGIMEWCENGIMGKLKILAWFPFL